MLAEHPGNAVLSSAQTPRRARASPIGKIAQAFGRLPTRPPVGAVGSCARCTGDRLTARAHQCPVRRSSTRCEVNVEIAMAPSGAPRTR